MIVTVNRAVSESTSLPAKARSIIHFFTVTTPLSPRFRDPPFPPPLIDSSSNCRSSNGFPKIDSLAMMSMETSFEKMPVYNCDIVMTRLRDLSVQFSKRHSRFLARVNLDRPNLLYEVLFENSSPDISRFKIKREIFVPTRSDIY